MLVLLTSWKYILYIKFAMLLEKIRHCQGAGVIAHHKVDGKKAWVARIRFPEPM